MIDCSICLGPALVPVRFRCFHCRSQKGKPSCHDLRRACLTCARTYLGLNLPRAERLEHRKCLICPAVCYPQTIRDAEEAYEKDYLLMSLDKKTDYPCSHKNKGCTFVGDQNQISQHLSKECNHRFTSCKCGSFYPIMDAEKHQRNCPYYEECKTCRRFIGSDVFVDHLHTVHDMIRCPHVECPDVIRTAEREAHLQSCRFRTVQCTVCELPLRFLYLGKHLMDHVQRSNKDIAYAMQMLEKSEAQLHASAHALKHHHESCSKLCMSITTSSSSSSS